MRKVSVDWKNSVLWLLNIIVQQFIAIIVLHILWNLFDRENFNIKSLGTWHILLCTIGYGLLMSEALIIFSNSSILTYGVARKDKAIVHIILMVLATLFVTIGISFKIYQKSTHFTSVHAITGLVSWIFTLCGSLLGISSYYSPKLKAVMKPVIFKFIHNFTGFVAYTIGLVSLYYGLYKFVITSSDNTKAAISVLILIVGLFSGSSAFISMLVQFRSSIK